MKLGYSLLLAAIFAAFVGCSEANPSPQAKLKTPLGTSQVCHHCLQPVNPVTKDHLITLGGVQYVVCSPACATEVANSLDSQGTIVPGADK